MVSKHPYLSEGDGALDIGANVGEVTTQYAEAVGSRGHVLAVEPDGRAADALRGRVGKYPWVTVMQVAVADTMRPITLYQSQESPQNSLWEANILGDSPGVLETRAVTLDFLAGMIPNLRMIKIDAQGAEPWILDGAHETLAKDGIAWAVELWNTGCRNAGRDVVTDVLDVFTHYGYRIVDEAHPDTLADRLHSHNGHSAHDVVFVKDS